MHRTVRNVVGTALLSSCVLVGACGGGGGGDKQAFCKELNATEDDIGADTFTVEGADEGAAVFDDLVDKAPEDIKDSVEVLSDAVDEVADAESKAEISKIQDRLGDDPKIEKAIEDIDAYNKKECGAKP